MLQYRKANIADISALVQLRIALLKEVMKIDQPATDITDALVKYFEDHLPKGDYISWLALEGDTIVSTNGMFFYDFPPNFITTVGQRAYILNVYTLPQYRRKGIARILFAKLMEEVAARDIKQVSLHTSPDGMTMYTEFGFKTKGNEMVWGQHI
jgi:ribosomal protein S18 acetylase RimI-like enzyme